MRLVTLATPGHTTQPVGNALELLVAVPLAGGGLLCALLWRGAVVRAWRRPVGLA